MPFIIRVQTMEEEKANIPTFIKPLFAANFVELKEVAICERPMPEETNIAFKCDDPSGSSFIFQLSLSHFQALSDQVKAAEQRFTNLKGNRN